MQASLMDIGDWIDLFGAELLGPEVDDERAPCPAAVAEPVVPGAASWLHPAAALLQ